MSFAFITHGSMCFLWPALVLAQGKCPNPHCGEEHYSVTVSWLLWSINLTV